MANFEVVIYKKPTQAPQMHNQQQNQKHSHIPVSTVPLDHQNLEPPHEAASREKMIDILEEKHQEKSKEISRMHNHQLDHEQQLSTQDRTFAMLSHHRNQKPSQKLVSAVPFDQQNLETPPHQPASKKRKIDTLEDKYQEVGGLEDKTIYELNPPTIPPQPLQEPLQEPVSKRRKIDQKPELKKEGEGQDKGGTIDMIDLTSGGEEPILKEESMQEKKIVMEEEIIDLTKEEEEKEKEDIIDLTKEEEEKGEEEIIDLTKEEEEKEEEEIIDLTKEVIDFTREIIEQNGWEEYLMWSRDSDLN